LDKKFPIITFTDKNTGQGATLCRFEFVDTEGTRMLALAYNDMCTKYHSELQVGSIYCFSGCRIEKVRSSRSLGLSQSRFLFIFGDKMTIEEMKADAADILSFPIIHFSTVDEILDRKPGHLVDFVATIKKAGDLVEKEIRNGNVLPMREIELSDDSTEDTVLYLFYNFSINIIIFLIFV